MTKYKWIDGMGRVELVIDKANAKMIGSPGESLGQVKEARKDIDVSHIDEEELRKTLRGYGAWSDEELQDHDENLNRIVWIAGCDINERPDDYPIVN